MAEIQEITKIEYLNGKSYQTWKYKIKLVLMEQRLYGLKNGTEAQPTKTSTEQVKIAHQLRSDKEYSLIALNVEKNLQIHISTTINPLEAWEIL